MGGRKLLSWKNGSGRKTAPIENFLTERTFIAPEVPLPASLRSKVYCTRP
jgi:hypothetical protein